MVTHRITFKASVSQGAGSRVVSAHGQGPSPIHTFHTHTHTRRRRCGYTWARERVVHVLVRLELIPCLLPLSLLLSSLGRA